MIEEIGKINGEFTVSLNNCASQKLRVGLSLYNSTQLIPIPAAIKNTNPRKKTGKISSANNRSGAHKTSTLTKTIRLRESGALVLLIGTINLIEHWSSSSNKFLRATRVLAID
jgi:hypothetical protein